MLSKAYLYAGMKKRVLVDLPEEMKKERNRRATKAYEIRHSEGHKRQRARNDIRSKAEILRSRG